MKIATMMFLALLVILLSGCSSEATSPDSGPSGDDARGTDGPRQADAAVDVFIPKDATDAAKNEEATDTGFKSDAGSTDSSRSDVAETSTDTGFDGGVTDGGKDAAKETGPDASDASDEPSCPAYPFRCMGQQPQICAGAGVWGNTGSPCLEGSATPVCSVGKCVPPTTLASVAGGITALAVESTYLYALDVHRAYSGVKTNSVLIVPINDSLDGGMPPTLATSADGGGGGSTIATDSTGVYWPDEGAGTIMKVGLTGGSPQTLASGQLSPLYVAVNSKGIYWGSGCNVNKVDLKGGPVTTLAASPCISGPLCADATNVYWLGRVTIDGGVNGTVAKCAAKGCGGTPTILATFAVSDEGFGTLAVDSTNVYWESPETNGKSNGMVMSVPITGGTTTTLASGQDFPSSLAIDSLNVYWTNVSTLTSVPLGGGVITTLVSGLVTPSALVVDSENAYWVNEDESVMMLPK